MVAEIIEKLTCYHGVHLRTEFIIRYPNELLTGTFLNNGIFTTYTDTIIMT